MYPFVARMRVGVSMEARGVETVQPVVDFEIEVAGVLVWRFRPFKRASLRIPIVRT